MMSRSAPSGRKNILLLIPTFAVPGGTQKLVSELGKVLSERYNVFECSFDALREAHVFPNDNTVLSLWVAPSANIIQRLAGYALKARRLNRLKKRHNIDITISNLWPADLINVLSMGRGKRISVGHTGVIGNEENRPLLRLHRAIGWVYRRFDKVVAVNTCLMEELSGLFALPPSQCACIHNFVTGSHAPATRPTSLPARKRVVWSGRLHPGKNLAPLLAIFRTVKGRLPEAQLVVLGEGPQRDELVAMARSRGLTVSDAIEAAGADVVFLGFVPNPYQYLRACDLFVLTSRSEGLPLVIVEAMSVGLPVLAADCATGGPHSIMEGRLRYQPGRTACEETPYGYLLPVPEPGNPIVDAMWEDAITSLLTNESARLGKGANGIRRAADFLPSQIKHAWFGLLDSL